MKSFFKKPFYKGLKIDNSEPEKYNYSVKRATTPITGEQDPLLGGERGLSWQSTNALNPPLLEKAKEFFILYYTVESIYGNHI